LRTTRSAPHFHDVSTSVWLFNIFNSINTG
jgi:hypothetical protein